MEKRENIENHQAELDIAVLLIFFCRPDSLAQVFDKVKKARPARLYLYQDGPREGNATDRNNIKKCREVVSDVNIDWDCEVHRFYQEKNVGVDPSGYIADTWMFHTEEKGIILEDDCVPDLSFFRFCCELLDKYVDDDRISFISGRNNSGCSNEINTSYTFTGEGGAIWGWATWKRLVDTWDSTYGWLEDKKSLEIIKRNIKNQPFKYFVKTSKNRKRENIAYFETILEASLCLHGGLYIVPKKNLIKNVGVTSDSAHSTSDARLLTKRMFHIMNLESYELDFPLVHPNDVCEDQNFRPFPTMDPHPILSSIEYALRIFRYEGLSGITLRIKRKLYR